MDVKNIVDLLKEQEKKQNRRKIVVILFLIICSISFIIIISLTIFKTEKANKILFIDNDSLKTKNSSFVVIELKKEKAKRRISSYFNRKGINNIDSLKNLFTETLTRYYTYEGVKRDFIISEDNKYWKKYPNDEFINDGNMAVDLLPGDTIKCLIIGKYSKDRKEYIDIIQEFKLNPDYKIFYVRSFYSNNTQNKTDYE